jgi:hypothetical protein
VCVCVYIHIQNIHVYIHVGAGVVQSGQCLTTNWTAGIRFPREAEANKTDTVYVRSNICEIAELVKHVT